MTESIAATDAYARSCTARVISSGPDGVVLDRTVFYPGGGGQPADIGLIKTDRATWTVTGARKAAGDIQHLVEPAPDGSMPKVGATVDAEIVGAPPSAHAHPFRPPRTVRGRMA
jgi:misacylated tRNA(Ala) deacylase